MNAKPFVSWGMYGGTTATESANFFASWGLMDALNAGPTPPVVSLRGFLMLFGIGN
jgi:hypothetical protein